MYSDSGRPDYPSPGQHLVTGEQDFVFCPRCGDEIGPARVPDEGVCAACWKQVAPELDICSRCKDHTEFVWDADEKGVVSVCCTAGPVSVDVEPHDA